MNQSAQNANNLLNWYLWFVGVVSPLSEIKVQTVSYLPLFLDRQVAMHWQLHVNNTMSLFLLIVLVKRKYCSWERWGLSCDILVKGQGLIKRAFNKIGKSYIITIKTLITFFVQFFNRFTINLEIMKYLIGGGNWSYFLFGMGLFRFPNYGK